MCCCRTEITRFPHAVLEVKLSLPEGQSAPPWVQVGCGEEGGRMAGQARGCLDGGAERGPSSCWSLALHCPALPVRTCVSSCLYDQLSPQHPLSPGHATHLTPSPVRPLTTHRPTPSPQELLDSGYLTEVHKFSKFIHGTATLFPDMVGGRAHPGLGRGWEGRHEV